MHSPLPHLSSEPFFLPTFPPTARSLPLPNCHPQGSLFSYLPQAEPLHTHKNTLPSPSHSFSPTMKDSLLPPYPEHNTATC